MTGFNADLNTITVPENTERTEQGLSARDAIFKNLSSGFVKTKAQTSLCILTVWLALLLFDSWK